MQKQELFTDIFYPDKMMKIRDNNENVDSNVKEQNTNDNIYGLILDVANWKIKTNMNQVFFSGDIVENSMLELIDNIDIAVNTIYELKRRANVDIPLRLIINSPGGSVKAGFMAIDYIRSLPIQLETYILGQAASMAFILWLAGNKRDMSENSSILIHQIRTGIAGKKSEIDDYIKHLNDLHSQLIEFTVKMTGLDKKVIEDLFARETWLTRREAIKLNLLKGV